jgi:hypothetical protein
MDSENTTNKSKRSKIKRGKIWPIPAKVTAHVVGCDPDTVRKMRSAERSSHTALGKQVVLADSLLVEGSNVLLEKVKELIAH